MIRIDQFNVSKSFFPFNLELEEIDRFCKIGILIMVLIASMPAANAQCACSGGNAWEATAQAFLNTDEVGGQPASFGSSGSSFNTAQNSGTSNPVIVDRIGSFPNGKILKELKSVSSSDVVVDVSNDDTYSKSHIKNAIHIPAGNFLNGTGILKTSQELSKMLGESGISADDSVVVYSSSQNSGEAELAFWVMTYLGHGDAKVLDGGLAEWKAAGLPVESSDNKRPATDYLPNPKRELLAEYDYVASGQAQIVDARPFVEMAKGRIPGSSAFDPSNILKGNKIKDVADLSIVLGRLSREDPIVVYSDDYSRSSLVWYALQLMGYKASIYTWDDWKAHELEDVKHNNSQNKGATGSSKYLKLSRT
jgi:thiosulfate/3-mercaptopyruvate sulfurtransferase